MYEVRPGGGARYASLAAVVVAAFATWALVAARADLPAGGDLLAGAGLLLLVALAGGWGFHRVARPGAPDPPARAIERDHVQWVLAAIPLLGWSVLLGAHGLSFERRGRLLWRIGVVVWLPAAVAVAAAGPDLITEAALVAWLGLGLATASAGARELMWQPRTQPNAEAGALTDTAAPQDTAATGDEAAPTVDLTGAADGDTAEPADGLAAAARLGIKVVPADQLPGFAQVGGMEPLKREIDETIGLLLLNAADAEAYRITWNGVLLHGPPGVGKTFLAKAIAGEFGLNFLHVSTGDLVSSYAGESAANVKAAFAAADAARPSLLFFDEFDSVAASRADGVEAEARRTVNQLLTSVEEYRDKRDLVVAAATNSIDHLDSAVIRPGRFDRHIRIDLPDRDARKAIFAATLKGRPCAAEIDLDELADRTAGLTPASITHAVELASLAAFKEAAECGEVVEVTFDHVVRALKERGGRDRPTIEDWTWERLVLPPAVKAELRQLQALIEHPERARALGVDPPSGVLLAGPPGTGKTTIARVLAAQARCSFYPVSAADVTSKWLGESERAIQQLFRRARENRPSIIFIDEIDAIASQRGTWGTYDRQVNQLLKEIDGMTSQPGVLVMAATNRPDRLDPALLRGGRLSRTVTIPLPDQEGRERLLRLLTERMPTVAVELKALARRTEGLSGADLNALCQQAALAALVRAGDGAVQVTAADFEQAHQAIAGPRQALHA